VGPIAASYPRGSVAGACGVGPVVKGDVVGSQSRRAGPATGSLIFRSAEETATPFDWPLRTERAPPEHLRRVHPSSTGRTTGHRIDGCWGMDRAQDQHRVKCSMVLPWINSTFDRADEAECWVRLRSAVDRHADYGSDVCTYALRLVYVSSTAPPCLSSLRKRIGIFLAQAGSSINTSTGS
jgi:hypothetical protein